MNTTISIKQSGDAILLAVDGNPEEAFTQPFYARSSGSHIVIRYGTTFLRCPVAGLTIDDVPQTDAKEAIAALAALPNFSAAG
jgi:hypothetical protein